MKIAVLTEYYPAPDDPGRGAYVHTRARAYGRAGHQVCVCQPRSQALDSEEQDAVWLLRGPPAQLLGQLERWHADVLAVHTPHPNAPHTWIAASLAVPRVAWIHGYEAMLTARHGYHRGLDRALSLLHDSRKLWRLRRFLTGAAAVVYPSDYLRGTAERYLFYRHPRAEIVPNPVDVELFRPAGHAGRPVPGGLALRAFQPQYGLDTAVAAFADLKETHLTIVGRGPEAPRLRALAREVRAAVTIQERVVPHHEVPNVLNDFDYFVSSVRTETQGLTMCEAMACGRPVIASRVGGIPEFVRDGKDGYLVPPDRPDAIRRAALRLAEDAGLRRRLGTSAREHIVATCADTVVIPRELALLAEAVA